MGESLTLEQLDAAIKALDASQLPNLKTIIVSPDQMVMINKLCIDMCGAPHDAGVKVTTYQGIPILEDKTKKETEQPVIIRHIPSDGYWCVVEYIDEDQIILAKLHNVDDPLEVTYPTKFLSMENIWEVAEMPDEPFTITAIGTTDISGELKIEILPDMHIEAEMNVENMCTDWKVKYYGYEY